VTELCRQLDGVPLALELAAMWMRALSLQQILDRLDDRFRLLAGGNPTAPPRQQALEAAIDWSYDLCSEAERTLWARLSVFSGGFDLDGAEEICSGAGIAREEVLGLISALLNKSIVTRAAGTARPVAWYYMLMSICQYGARRLGDETRGYQTRHRDHYRDLAAEWQADIFGPRQADWYLRLRQEHGNLRAALDFCLDGPGCGPAGLEIAAPIWNFWFTGFPREGYHYLQRALAAAPEPTPLRGLGLWAGGYNAMFIGEAEQQARWLSECADLAERFDDDHLRARIGEVAGHALLYRDDQPAAIGRLLPALDGFRAVGDGLGEFDVLTLLSAASFFLGDPRADEFGRQAYDLAAAAGAESSKAYAMLAVGVVQWRDHDRVDDATRSFRDAIRLWQPLNGRNGIAFCVQALSWCAASSAPTVAAARLMGASRAVWRSTGAHASRSTPYSRLDDQAEERVRAAIGDAAFDRAFVLGAAYSFEQAVALALGAEPVNRQVARTGLSGRLTPREHEIAGLIGEGLSNREIAARLVISQRTAETHVERILGKLAFTSRLQVARWVTGHGDT
jgi:DNA-binding NarL/FixJ family response regulator